MDKLPTTLSGLEDLEQAIQETTEALKSVVELMTMLKAVQEADDATEADIIDGTARPMPPQLNAPEEEA